MDRQGGIDAARRIAAAPYGWVLPGALLAVAAVVESAWHATGSPLAQSIGTPLCLLVFGLIGLATTLPLAPLWAQPAVAAVVASAMSVLSLAAFQTLTVAAVAAVLIATHRLGRVGAPWRSLLVAAPFPVLALVGLAADYPADGEARVLTLLLATAAPAAALAGTASRARREARENGAARQVIADTLLEHTARGERARIARELHDVVAHHISMVAVQAETARLTTPGMPAAGADRLLAIGDTARSALTEMRRLLGVLREDATAEPAALHPQPGLRELNELLDTARDATGTGTRLILRGTPVALDPGVELTVYRIVQEALTNARRHAPGAAVDVELHYTDDLLRLRIRDNGPGPPPTAPGGGHGLSGMRERAAAVGGELSAGPTAGGGFRVEARLPGRDGTTG